MQSPDQPAATGAGSRPRAEGSVASGSVAAFLSLATSATLTAALTLVLIRVLGRVEYGIFALALSIHQVVLLLSDVGLTSACAREIASSRSDPHRLRMTVGSTLAAKLGTSITAGILLVAASGPLADVFDTPRLADVLRLAAAAMTLTSVFQLFRLGLNSLGARWSMFGLVVVESVLEVAASLALIVASATAAAAMGGRIVGYACGFVLGLWLLVHRAGGLERPSRGVVTRVLQAGLFIGVAEGVYILFTQVDVLLIGAVLGPAHVAQFEAPLRILVIAGFVGYALGLATVPQLAAGGDLAAHGQRFARALRYVACLQAALLPAWLVLIAPNATLIFGDDFTESSEVLYGLTPYFFLAGIAPLASLATIYAGGERRRIVPSLFALALNAGITAALLDSIGIVAGAVGTGIGSAVYVAMFLSLAGQLLNIPRGSLIRFVVLPAACGALAAGFAVAAWLVDPLVGIVALVPAAGLHLMLLRASGALSGEEVRRLRQFLTGLPAVIRR